MPEPGSLPSEEEIVAALRGYAPVVGETELRALARMLAALAAGREPEVAGRGLDPLLEKLRGASVDFGNRQIDFSRGQLGDVTMRDTAGRDITYNIYFGSQAAAPAGQAELEQQIQRGRQKLTWLEQQGGPNPPDFLADDIAAEQQKLASLEARLAQLSCGPARVPDNLPVMAGVFVGRKQELATCLAALDPAERGWGVTIDGIGGMGKTALAIETARIARAKGMFDAYLFVSAKTTYLTDEGVREETLALTSLDSFVAEFARLLELKLPPEGNDTARRQALLDGLQARRTLTIWDNLETLTKPERDRIAEFLRRLPGANKAILTSRRRTGESAVTLRLDRLSAEEAVELMREVGKLRPRVADALRRATTAERRALYEATGGNPLALHWSLGQIAHRGYSLAGAISRLSDPNRSGDLHSFLFKDALASLRANERNVLVALSTFRTPADPAELCAAAGLSMESTEIAIEALVVLSLVDDLDDGRFTLHPLTRGYVRTALDAAELSAEAERRALAYWRDLAAQYGGEANDAYKNFPTLEASWPSLEAAAERLYALSGLPGPLLDRDAARMLVDLIRELRWFLDFSGRWESRINLSAQAYKAALTLEDWSGAFWCAYHVAFSLLNQAQTDKAASWVEKAIADKRLGRREEGFAFQLRGLLAERLDDLISAQSFYEQALAIARELQNELDLALYLVNLASVASLRKDYVIERECYRQALAIHERRGEEPYISHVLANLGMLAWDLKDNAAARDYFERGLTLARKVGREETIASCEGGLARVLEDEGHYAEALTRAEIALTIYERTGHANLNRTRRLAERLRQRIGSE